SCSSRGGGPRGLGNGQITRPRPAAQYDREISHRLGLVYSWNVWTVVRDSGRTDCRDNLVPETRQYRRTSPISLGIPTRRHRLCTGVRALAGWAAAVGGGDE